MVVKFLDDPRVGHGSTESEDPSVVGQRPIVQFGESGEVQETPGAGPVEVDVDHEIGTPADRHKVGFLRLSG